jgi:hypothetical protein
MTVPPRFQRDAPEIRYERPTHPQMHGSCDVHRLGFSGRERYEASSTHPQVQTKGRQCHGGFTLLRGGRHLPRRLRTLMHLYLSGRELDSTGEQRGDVLPDPL